MNRALVRQPGKRTARMLAVVLFVVVGGMAGWRVLQAPASGTITPVVPAHTVALDATVQSAPKTVSSKLASFTYPTSFTPGVAQPNSEPEVFTFVQAGGANGSSSQLSITLSAAGGPVTDSSAYRYRQLHPDIYKPHLFEAQGVRLPGFTATNTDSGTEQVVFWQHGTASVTIAITAQSGDDQAANLSALQQVLDSWQWQ